MVKWRNKNVMLKMLKYSYTDGETR